MIKLYTKPNCQGCRMSKRFFDTKGITYDAIDVTDNDSALAHIQELGYMTLPVVETPTQHFSGYQPDRLALLAA